MSLAQLVKDMAAAGAPIDAIIMALEAVEARDKADADRREKAAARKRAQRDRERDEGVTVTGQSQDESQAAPFPAPPNENNLTPPTHTPETKTPARKGHRLPEGWQPKPLPTEIAEGVAGWVPGAIEREMSKFRDWAASAPSSKALKSDWDATWRNWLRRAIEDGKHNRTGNTGQGRTSAAAQEVLRRIGGSGAPLGADAGRTGDGRARPLPYPVRAIGHDAR